MNRPVLAAIGYQELGMLEDALDCLDKVSEEHRDFPTVLNMRLNICRDIKRHEGMAKVAEHLTKIVPDKVYFWINLP